jgi:hypothetical protein
VTATADDEAVQPFAEVTVTEKLPGSVTMMDCVVAPLDQR